jgi:2-oxoglutarate ferredoxin oxidoreductase subunit alpha
MQAFNLAEQYRCPVFVAANKEISMTRETLDLEALDLPPIINRQVADPTVPFLPFGVRDNQPVPDFLPIGGDRLVRQTSSTHAADGYITTDSDQIAMMQARLDTKLKAAVSEFTFFEEVNVPGADTLVIAYGITARAAKAAVRDGRNCDHPASLLILKTLWPVPEALIREKAATYKRVVMPEMNLGQYIREIQRLLPEKKIDFLGQMNGELIKPGQIKEVIQNG